MYAFQPTNIQTEFTSRLSAAGVEAPREPGSEPLTVSVMESLSEADTRTGPSEPRTSESVVKIGQAQLRRGSPQHAGLGPSTFFLSVPAHLAHMEVRGLV